MSPPLQQNQQNMSVQKLKIFKKLKGGQGYSKNPILDSLIKQKLQSEMIIIKDNFNTIIQRQEARQKQIDIEKLKKKRRLSTQNLATITTERIKESINFNHQKQKEVLQFVINRQKASPFMEKAEIEGINTARTNYESITVKMNESDKVNYQLHGGIKDNKFDEEYQQNLTERLKQILPSDVWLPQQPQVQQILTTKAQQLQLSPLKLPNTLKFSLSHRPSSHSFEPLKSSRQKIPKKIAEEQGEITYDPNRYHKSDYSSLQRWLENSIQSSHKRHQKKLSSGENIQGELNSHLNGIYSVYISTIKEIIRLTYIQSAQKGLLMQKVIWSFIRLFEELIQQQHKANYQEFKQSSKETKQLRQLYEQRISKLQNLLYKRQQQIHHFSQTKKQIVMSCITYRKVNIQMNDEIQTLMKYIKSMHHQNNYLMNNLTKLIHQFEKREVIKIQKQDNFNLYYYLNQKNEIEVVARVPKEELLEKFFDSEMKQASIHNIEEEIAKEETKIDRLQNDLTNFWRKKKNYLEIDKIIQENFVGGIEEIGIQVDVNGPNPYADKQTQFPQEKQETFEDFLKRQIVQQRESWSKKQVQLKEVTVTLKQLYDQARESITFLSSQNVTLKQTIDQKDHQISYLKRKIEQLEEKTTLFGKKIGLQQKEIEDSKAEEVRMKEEIAKAVERYNQQKKRHLFEKENNNILVSSNYQLKSSLEKSTKEFEQLQQKIRILAPSLQQMMSLAQTSQNSILTKLSTLIETHLSKYVEKDAQVFLTH